MVFYSIFLQQELYTVKVEWNSHYIRKSKNSQISAIPDKLFSTQQLHGYVNWFKEISLEDIDTLFQEYEIRNQKNIASDAKEILNDHDSTLILNTLITLFQKKNWITLHVIGSKNYVRKNYRLFRTLIYRDCSCESSNFCTGI